MAPVGRGLFAVGVALVATASIALTATTVLSRSAPEIAGRLTLWPSAGDARVADRVLVADLSLANARTARETAARVLMHQPMDVVAARVAGTAESVLGNPAPALRAFTYAERLSRRDAATQFALIEDRVAQGDIPAALLHYNRAMQVSASSRPVLLPVLVAATGQAPVRDGLRPLLRQRPFWWRDYVEEQVASGTDPAAIADAIVTTGLKGEAGDRTALYSRALAKLAGTGQVRWAARIDGRPTGAVRNGDFASTETLPPFDWSIGDQADLGAVIEPRDGARGNALSIVATGMDGGEVAKQLLAMAPGRYRLSATSGNVPEEARAWLTLSCVSPGRPTAGLALLKLPVSAGGMARQAATDVVIPSSCQGQWLQVWASRTSNQPDRLPWADDIVLRPIG